MSTSQITVFRHDVNSRAFSRIPQQHRVFLVCFKLAIQDSDIPSPRWHTNLFVETEKDGAGYIHEVNGDITSPQGMTYLPTFQSAPETSETFFLKEPLGFMMSPHLEPWRALLESVPAPHQQKAFNIATMRTEPFKTLVPLTFYTAGKERRPLIRCTEWTLDRAIPALKRLVSSTKATLSRCVNRVQMDKFLKYLSRKHAYTREDGF